VIGNAYRDGLFRLLPEVERRHDLLFVGRLVSDKGVDILLEALAVLARRGLRPPLTIVGEGPDRERLEDQSRSLELGTQVRFLGALVGDELVRVMNSHQILVVPSRYNEPFGIVALEGLACGCEVVASRGGGLSEAVGPCGITFRNGDVDDLATALEAAWSKPVTQRQTLSRQVATHLETHRASTVIARYLKVLQDVMTQPADALAQRVT
jgi:glycosyltransferase involved in cell wall biosynthesis